MDNKPFDERIISNYLVKAEWIKDVENEKLKLVAKVTKCDSGITIPVEFDTVEEYYEWCGTWKGANSATILQPSDKD